MAEAGSDSHGSSSNLLPEEVKTGGTYIVELRNILSDHSGFIVLSSVSCWAFEFTHEVLNAYCVYRRRDC